MGRYEDERLAEGRFAAFTDKKERKLLASDYRRKKMDTCMQKVRAARVALLSASMSACCGPVFGQAVCPEASGFYWVISGLLYTFFTFPRMLIV